MLSPRLIVKGITLSAFALILTEAGDYFIFNQEPHVSLKEGGIALGLGFIYTFFPWLKELNERHKETE